MSEHRLRAFRISAPRPWGRMSPAFRCTRRRSSKYLSGRFLARPDWANGLEILSIAIMGSLLVVLTIFVSPAIALVAGLLITGFALVASWLAFSFAGLLFDPLAPVAAGTITHFAVTAFRFLVTDRERRAIRRAFGQYLSPSLLYRIEHTRNALRLGGDDRELTVMFVDVRNFTEISERLSPTAVVGFLNTLLDALSRHVTANEGTLDKYIGDFDHGLLERAARCRRSPPQGSASGSGHARHDGPSQRRRTPLASALSKRSASALESTPALRASAIWAPRPGSIIRLSAMP